MLPTKYSPCFPSFTVLCLSSWKFHVRLVNPFAFPKTICSCHPAVCMDRGDCHPGMQNTKKMKNGSLFIDVLYSLFHVWFYKARSRFFLQSPYHFKHNRVHFHTCDIKKNKCKLPIPYKYQEARIIKWDLNPPMMLVESCHFWRHGHRSPVANIQSLRVRCFIFGPY